MEKRDRSDGKQKRGLSNWRTPRLRYRLGIYALCLAFSVLSVWQVSCGALPEIAAYAVYAAAGIALCLACVCAVRDVRSLKNRVAELLLYFKGKYRFVRRVLEDYRYRTFLFTVSGFLMNTAYALFHGFLGASGRSPWYVTLAVYYFLLGLMKFWVVNHERKIVGTRRNAERDGTAVRKKEIAVCRNCSVSILLMTAALSGMVILTVHSEGGASYPGITIYVMALYTFIKAPLAVRNWILAEKEKTLYLVTTRSIAFADACVSVLSLQTAMFASFSGSAVSFEQTMNGVTGGIVCILVLGMGIYGVYSASRMGKSA